MEWSARGSRKGRPCNALGLSAQRLSAACPHLRAPGAPCPRWAHHSAILCGNGRTLKGTARIMPDNGMAERMNRTLKEATVRRYHDESHRQLRQHLADFLAASDFAKRRKTLRGLTPHEYVCKILTQEPASFRLDPCHHTAGLYMPGVREFGGAVVIESMALGITLIVADYAGPSELVDDKIEIRVAFRDKQSLIDGMRRAIGEAVRFPETLDKLGAAGREKAREKLTWEAKANQILAVYDAVLAGAKNLHSLDYHLQ